MQSKTSAPPRKPSFSRDDVENSSLAQVLSQRLTNMEQQLFLLRDDLKNAVGTLKEKDREIVTLQNKIALAERRREREEAGKPVDESLREVSAGVDSKLDSKRDMLENEVVTLAKKLEEMEKFFGDYGLAWVKEDALNETDPNNLWIRKSNIHYTPDFEKVFLVVEELNLGNAEPQIVRKGNTAQFKKAQLLNLTLYADGIQLENNAFRQYDSPSVEEFFRDLEDGYFPTELKGSHPEGVIFKVKDKRTINFADDPEKRPVIQRGATSKVPPAASPSSPTSLSSLRAASRRSTSPGSSGSSRAQAEKNAKDRLASSSSRKGSSSKRRSSLKKTPSRPSRSSGDGKSVDPIVESEQKRNSTSNTIQTDDSKTVAPTTPVTVGEDSLGSEKPAEAAHTEDTAKPQVPPEVSGDAADTQESDTKKPSEIPEGGPPSVSGTPEDAPPIPSNQEKPNPEHEFKELFRGKTPRLSTQLLPDHSAEPVMKGQPKDAYGLPKPPFPSSSNTATDIRPLPLGPPSKQFDNFVFPKTTETQTSQTLMPGIKLGFAPQAPLSAPCPQPTHVTNITYNEAPITIQMSPSEFLSPKGGAEAAYPQATQGRISCPTHQPRPCNCVHVPGDTCPDEPKDGPFGSVRLAKFPADTEYRERFTESAINNQNVLEFKKRSQEAKGPHPMPHSPSPAPVPRQPAATVLVGPDEAPVPPDPLQPHSLIDPNVKWEHFTFLGHPKGQEAVAAQQAPKGPSPKRKSSPQVVQLNEKTSDRMISVRMKTKSGSKEFVAHLYPDEQVSRVWSLLKMNEKTQYLSTDDHKVIPPGTVAMEISTDQVLRIFRLKSEGSTVKTRFDPNRFPAFTAKDPEYFKTQSDEKKKNPGSTKKKAGDGFRHRTDVRTLKDHIDEVKLMKDENQDGDDGSRDIFISPYENRDWLSKETYRKKTIPRVPSKELERMLEQFRDQERSNAPRNAAQEDTIGAVSESQVAALKVSGQSPDSSPPQIVLDDTESVTSVPKRYTKDLRGALGRSKSGQSLSPEIDVNRSSSLISESKVHIGSYVPEQRQKIKITDLREPPADFPRSSSSINLQASSGKLNYSDDFKANSSHSIIFKRQSSIGDVVSGGQSNVLGSNIVELSEGSVAIVTEGGHVEKQRHQMNQLPAVRKQSNLERSSSKVFTQQSAKKVQDVGPSGIGPDGFEAATLLEIVKAMLEAEQEHERDKEKLKQSCRIVVPKSSPEPTPPPSAFSIPEETVDELESLRQSFEPPLATDPKISPSRVDQAFIEQLLTEIRTRKCTLDEALKEMSKGGHIPHSEN